MTTTAAFIILGMCAFMIVGTIAGAIGVVMLHRQSNERR